jgi:hypothetical protein
MPREPVLRNTCHGPRTSLPQRACHSTDHVQQNISPNRPTRHRLRGERGGRGTTTSRTTTRASNERSPPKSACSGDAVLRTSTRGTVHSPMWTVPRVLDSSTTLSSDHHMVCLLAFVCAALNSASLAVFRCPLVHTLEECLRVRRPNPCVNRSEQTRTTDALFSGAHLPARHMLAVSRNDHVFAVRMPFVQNSDTHAKHRGVCAAPSPQVCADAHQRRLCTHMGRQSVQPPTLARPESIETERPRPHAPSGVVRQEQNRATHAKHLGVWVLFHSSSPASCACCCRPFTCLRSCRTWTLVTPDAGLFL